MLLNSFAPVNLFAEEYQEPAAEYVEPVEGSSPEETAPVAQEEIPAVPEQKPSATPTPEPTATVTLTPINPGGGYNPPSEHGTGDRTSAKTGDNTNVFGLLLMMLFAMGTGIILIRRKRIRK